MNEIPRRIRIDKLTPAELAIRDAVLAVEAAGCDPRLTDAVVLLGQAKEKVADFVDGVETPKRERWRITEDWLRENGFKWHQLEGQDRKQWLLWLGSAIRESSFEDLGVEVAEWRDGSWFCWLRSDFAHRYSRFIHVRHLRFVDELAALIEGVTGQEFDASNNLYGSMRKPKDAARLREEDRRTDLLWLRQSRHWREIEKDDSRGQALPEHHEFHEKARGNVTNFEGQHAQFGWIDGRIHAPKKNELVLCAGPDGVSLCFGSWICLKKLRWWMPLPKPPAGDVKHGPAPQEEA